MKTPQIMGTNYPELEYRRSRDKIRKIKYTLWENKMEKILYIYIISSISLRKMLVCYSTRVIKMSPLMTSLLLSSLKRPIVSLQLTKLASEAERWVKNRNTVRKIGKIDVSKKVWLAENSVGILLLLVIFVLFCFQGWQMIILVSFHRNGKNQILPLF